jgi:methionine biosynthesis protein MetW
MMTNQGDGGLLAQAPDPYRYDGHSLDAENVGGIVASHVPHGASILDVGCATGSLATLLRDARGARVVGIEPDPVRAALAAQRGIEVRVGVLSPPLAQTLGTFDVVIYADVLEHLPDPLGELANALPHIKPDGVLIVSVPNVAHWSVRWSLLRGRFTYEETGIMDSTHLRWFTRDSILALLSKAGIEPEHVEYTIGLSLYVNALTTWIPGRLRGAIVRRLARIAPRLFAVQFVITGRRA